MKHSKKGITLVELVICCAIIVMLGGACTAVLSSGATIFNQSSSTANAQLDSDVLQTFMINTLPSAVNPDTSKSLTQAKALASGTAIYVEDDVLTIQIDGNSTTIPSIKEFTYSFICAGDPAHPGARTQMVYTATLSNGATLDGGFVLCNETYDASTMEYLVDIPASVTPLCFIPD